MFMELDRRQNANYAVSLEWDRDTGETQIVVADGRTAGVLAFLVPRESAGDAHGDQLDDARESRRGCYPIRKPAPRTTVRRMSDEPLPSGISDRVRRRLRHLRR